MKEASSNRCSLLSSHSERSFSLFPMFSTFSTSSLASALTQGVCPYWPREQIAQTLNSRCSFSKHKWCEKHAEDRTKRRLGLSELHSDAAGSHSAQYEQRGRSRDRLHMQQLHAAGGPDNIRMHVLACSTHTQGGALMGSVNMVPDELSLLPESCFYYPRTLMRLSMELF